MIYDPTPRAAKALDALSQFVNVGILPRHRETTANESISGRSFRQGWALRRWIDALFFWQRNPGHCERAYRADVKRARKTIEGADR